MMDLVGKEIINTSGVGILLFNKAIPDKTIGVVHACNYGLELVTIRWKINNEYVETTIPFNQYKKMISCKMIDFVSNYIETPPSLYKPGNLVQSKDGSIIGLIKSMGYSFGYRQWYYNIVDVKSTIIGDYIVKRVYEEDLDLKTEVISEISFKDNKYILNLVSVKE